MTTNKLPDNIPIVTGKDEQYLNQLQREDYADHRREVLIWLYYRGKSPAENEGYSEAVVENTAYRLSKIYRWVWKEYGYTATITHEYADAYVDSMRYRDWGRENKNQYVKTLKRYFGYRSTEQGVENWGPEQTYSPNQSSHHSRDYLTREERRLIRDASLGYGSVPAYDSLTGEERDRWRIHLAQRFEMPKREVGREEFEKATSWKIPSLVATALDAGLRPVEVERSRVEWIDLQNNLLRIPKEQDSKATEGGENWVVSLREDTTGKLKRWLQERRTRAKFDDSNAIWLTRYGNPYSSDSLNYLLEQLCEEAGIRTENRDISWYGIRHSTGTYMASEEGLSAAQEQLRHRDEKTTMRYDQVLPEDRREALDRM